MMWQPIESAPKDGTKILAFAPNHPDRGPIMRITWWRRREDGHNYIGWGEFNEQFWPPTHWQSLPDPPAASSLTDPETMGLPE